MMDTPYFMATPKLYDLFISHAWQLSNHYSRLEELLKRDEQFRWRNYSVPINDPLVPPDEIVSHEILMEQLMKQVKPVNCVLIIGDYKAARSKWVAQEIEIAQLYNKPILGVYPWGKKRIPSVVRQAAHELTAWNTSSIVTSIRRISL